MNKKKIKILSFSLVSAMLFSAIAYALLSQALTITGTANADASWDVKITDIVEGNLQNASTNGNVSHTGTTANFNVDLKQPGASAEYIITVENAGSVDAVLNSISGVNEVNAQEPVDIVFNIDAVENDTLDSGTTKEYKVTVEWEQTSNTIPVDKSKTASITLEYQQAS